ncbi:MAG TPA: flagellar hook-length control protein FliK [Gammaproteobacteria bacterium]|nr:flagellar hook-length control protein FliK [Gammaproteobacteria bacterium]
METTGPTGAPRLPATAAGTSTAAAQWQTGQLLQATVTESRIGSVLLAIGNRQVSAETSLPLEKGQQLTLQVRSLGAQPVLKITAGLGESPLAALTRQLLPQQAPLTPLLASIKLLAQHPATPAPAQLNTLVRNIIRQLPDVQAATTGTGLKQAIADSGVFLERRLLQTPAPGAAPPAVNSDFKANLLRLVQLVRNWPGTGHQGSTAGARPSGTPVTPGAPPVPVTGSGPTGTALPATATPPPTAQNAPPTASPDQLQRAVRAGVPARAATDTARPAPAAPPAAGSTTAAAGSTATPGVVTPGGDPAPPLRGTQPVPQSAVQVSLEVLNRLGNFRTDLLQQAEAALARIQLHQLAALPREAERGLLEWLFDLPIRRGDDINLWSLRLYRDGREQAQQQDPQTPRWSVQLAFDLPGLGPVQAQVQLQGEQVSTRFWTEQPDSLPLFREHLHELRGLLQQAGLEVGELDCQPGPRPAVKPAAGALQLSEKA